MFLSKRLMIFSSSLAKNEISYQIQSFAIFRTYIILINIMGISRILKRNFQKIRITLYFLDSFIYIFKIRCIGNKCHMEKILRQHLHTPTSSGFLILNPGTRPLWSTGSSSSRTSRCAACREWWSRRR